VGKALAIVRLVAAAANRAPDIVVLRHADTVRVSSATSTEAMGDATRVPARVLGADCRHPETGTAGRRMKRRGVPRAEDCPEEASGPGETWTEERVLANWRRKAMTISPINEPRRKTARIAGFMYLSMMATGLFAELYVRSNLIVSGNAAETARNIMASERLFRIGIACDLITFTGDVVLVVALYVLLKPVNHGLALLAALWRLAESAIGGVTTLNSIVVLLLLSGAGYLQAFRTEQLQALAMLFLGAQGAGYRIGMIFFGLGSTVFSYLFFKSKYIPRILAAWGVLSSLLVLVPLLALILVPSPGNIGWGYPGWRPPRWQAPIMVFEVAIGLWLLVKGVRPSGEAEPDKVGA
jgi:hypothetical protein